MSDIVAEVHMDVAYLAPSVRVEVLAEDSRSAEYPVTRPFEDRIGIHAWQLFVLPLQKPQACVENSIRNMSRKDFA